MIALIGPPGSGKTTVGEALAARLGLAFVDQDEVVTRRYGDIGEIVLAEGAERLAALLGETLAELAGGVGVLAVGSAALDDPRSAAALEGCTVVYLASDLAHTFPRSDLSRPQPPGLVSARQLWARMLAERDAGYRSVADLVVEVGDLGIADVVDSVLVLLPAGDTGRVG